MKEPDAVEGALPFSDWLMKHGVGVSGPGWVAANVKDAQLYGDYCHAAGRAENAKEVERLSTICPYPDCTDYERGFIAGVVNKYEANAYRAGHAVGRAEAKVEITATVCKEAHERGRSERHKEMRMYLEHLPGCSKWVWSSGKNRMLIASDNECCCGLNDVLAIRTGDGK